jgi:hypothetical protein
MQDQAVHHRRPNPQDLPAVCASASFSAADFPARPIKIYLTARSPRPTNDCTISLVLSPELLSTTTSFGGADSIFYRLDLTERMPTSPPRLTSLFFPRAARVSPMPSSKPWPHPSRWLPPTSAGTQKLCRMESVDSLSHRRTLPRFQRPSSGCSPIHPWPRQWAQRDGTCTRKIYHRDHDDPNRRRLQ